MKKTNEAIVRALDAALRAARKEVKSVAGVRALLVLDQAPLGQNMAALGHLLGVSSAAVTAIADALEEDGLLERARDGGDRRAVTLRLTERGADQVRRWVEVFDRVYAEAEVEVEA